MEWTTLATAVAALTLALPAAAQTDDARRKQRDAKLEAKRRELAQQARHAVPRLKFALKLLAEKGLSPSEFELAFQRDEVEAKLASQVSVDFPPRFPLGETLEFLRMVAGLNLVVAPACDLEVPVTLPRSRGTVREALGGIAGAAALEWSLVGAVVYLHPKGAKLPQVPEVDADWLAVYGERTVELNFSPPVSLGDGTDYLEQVLGAKFVVPEALRRSPVHLRVAKLSLPVALSLIADQAGATWTVEGGKVVFAPRE